MFLDILSNLIFLFLYNFFLFNNILNDLISFNYFINNPRNININDFFLLTNLFLFLRKLSIFFVFLFITLSVTEATIGLSLLTILVRRHGNDYIKINIF